MNTICTLDLNNLSECPGVAIREEDGVAFIHGIRVQDGDGIMYGPGKKFVGVIPKNRMPILPDPKPHKDDCRCPACRRKQKDSTS